MASNRTSHFLQAKQVMRMHPDWTDEQVTEHLLLKPTEAAAVIPAARKDVAATDTQTTTVQTTIGSPIT